MKGFGFSLIDNEPKELIYMSIYKFNFTFENVSNKYIVILYSGWKDNKNKIINLMNPMKKQ